MKNLRLIFDIYRHQPIVKAVFAFDWEWSALLSKKSLANIKTPSDWLIEEQNTDNIIVTIINV